MYSTVENYLNLFSSPSSNLRKERYIPHPSHIVAPRNSQFISRENYPVPTITWKSDYVGNTSDPKVWGPAFWFSLHTSAAHYPVNASPLVRERMKARILAIPYEIPCAACRPHASAYVEKYRAHLDHIVSGKHSLGQFYVDFHNQVNKRYNKKEWTYERAYAYYSGNVQVQYLR